MRKKQISILLVLLLVIQCILPASNYVYAAADTIKPELISASVDKSEVTVGDTVTVTVKAKDEGGSGLQRVYVYYYMPETGKTQWISMSANEEGTYTGTYTVGNDSENGEWNIAWISIYDNAENYTTIYYSSDSEQLKGCSFVVSGAEGGDTIKPELISASVDKSEVTVGDTVTVTVKAKDEGGSGLQRVYVYYYMPETGKTQWISMSANEEGTYTGTYTVGNDSENGEWNIAWISIYDNAENYTTIYYSSNSEQLKGCSFVVSGAEGGDTIKPELISASVDKSEVTVGDTVTVTVKAKDEGGSGLQRVYVYYYMPETGKTQWISMSANEEGTYTGTYTVGNDSENGEWNIAWISIYDNAENYTTIYYSSDSEKLKPASFTKFEDLTPPVYNSNSLSITQSRISVNDSTTVSFEASDDRGIQSAEITYYQPSSNNELVMPCLYNEALGVYEATYTANQYSQPGIWQIKSITIVDIYDNTAQIVNSDTVSLAAGDFEVYGTTLDSKAPVIDETSIKVNSNKVKFGKEFSFSFVATDDVSGIKTVVANYRKPNKELQEVEVTYNEETKRYEGSISSNEESDLGNWVLESLVMNDHAGNIGTYSAFEGKLDFSVYRKIDEISPVSGISVYLENAYISDTVIYNDIYIGPKAVLTLSNVTVYGDIYVLGALKSYSNVCFGGLYAKYMKWGGYPTLYNGTVVFYGSNSFSSLTSTTYPVTEIPLELVDNKVITVDGYLEMQGATANVATMYVDGEMVETSTDGRFVIEDRYVGEISSVRVQWVTVFGNVITKYYDVENFVTTNGVLNHKPTISGTDIYLSVGDSYNLLDYVSAYDIDDGDLTQEVTVSESTIDINKVGTCTVKYQVTDHLGETVFTTVTVYIGKGIPKVTFPAAEAIVYGQKLSEAVLVNGTGNGTFVWEDSEVQPNAGTSSYTMTFIPTDLDNYNSVSQEVSIEVKKAIPAYTVPENLSVSYGSVLGDISLPAGFSWKDDLMTKTGTTGQKVFKAVYTPIDTINYESIEDITVSVNVVPVSMSELEIEGVQEQQYTGNDIEPSLVIKHGTIELEAGVDYTATYKSNRNAGTATISIEGKGNYTGTRELTFIIQPREFQNHVSVSEIEDVVYTGNELTPAIVVKDNETALVLGEDYSVSYKENVTAGRATIVIEGKGNYTGNLQVNFTIQPKTLEEASLSEISTQVFTGEAIEPQPSILLGETTLKKNVDYTLEYKNNVNVGTAQIKVTGKGNYQGTREVIFTIVERDLSDVQLQGIEDQSFTGEEVTPALTLKFGKYQLKEGIDYEVIYTDNVQVGEANVTIEGRGNFTGTIESSFSIVQKSIKTVSVDKIANQAYTGVQLKPAVVVKDAGKVLVNGRDYTVIYKNNVNVGTATIIINGKGIYSGSIEKTYQITRRSIAVVKTSSIKTQTYTGKTMTPSVKVMDGTRTLKSGVDYKLVYTNNKNCGTATITITGTGNYSGSKKISFTIKPSKGVIAKAVSSKANTATISWNKVSSVSGYEVSYATSKNGKYKAIDTKSKTSYTIKGLKAKKTYYVKMRAYKTVSGKKVYGEFSKTKSVTIKR